MDNATYNRAIIEAGIDAPVYRVEEMEDGSFVFHLPSRTIVWQPAAAPTPTPQPTPQPDDFTAIPYVGKEIAQALRCAGFATFDDLVKASDVALLDIPQIGPFALSKIRKYLQEHYL